MKKRLFLLTVIAIAGFFLIAWWTAPTNITDIEDFGVIRFGMTEAEVVELLNARGAEATKVPPLDKPIRSCTWKEWRNRDGEGIVVAFDESGKVAAIAGLRVSEGWFDKVRHWLRPSR